MRIVAVSDLHGQFPPIPACDLLILGGDLCPDIFKDGRRKFLARDHPELQDAWFRQDLMSWLCRQRIGEVILTWGNHDFCGKLYPSGVTEINSKIKLVVDATVEVGDLKIWMTPWSNQFMDWAWMKPHQDLAEVYAKIPEDLDILVSHQPPYGCGDIYPSLETGKFEHIGSQELHDAIEQKTPTRVVCGHLHGGHGRYDIGDTEVLNVSVLDEGYNLSYVSTGFDV